ALGRELERDLGQLLAATAPRDDEKTGRLAPHDLMPRAVAALEALEPLRRRHLVRRQPGMVEAQLEGSAGARLHVARRHPLGALAGLGEVRPDPLDRPGQQALETDRPRRDELAELVHALASSGSKSWMRLPQVSSKTAVAGPGPALLGADLKTTPSPFRRVY